MTLSGFSILVGTYVERKMEQFLMSPKTNKTVIDELVLFEQRVNLFNGPVILMQLLWILASSLSEGFGYAMWLLGCVITRYSRNL